MCGIFGIIQNKRKKFDKRAFIMLGIANDRRGKDSCGIFIDQWSEYGVGKEKLFTDFFMNSSLLENLTDAKVILGHCRKASVGAVTAENAQPVVIKDENGNPEFVLIHNGTIFNYEDLAKEYIPDINTYGMTDSQVMAHIFYHCGYDVLGEYEGGGMFVMYDLRVDRVFMFKGSSLTSATATEPSEERPCYFVQTNDNLIFSSVFEELKGLYFSDIVYILPSNRLLTVKGGKLLSVKVYDRSQMCQVKKTKTYQYYSEYHGNYIEYNEKKNIYYGPDFKAASGAYYVSNYGYISQFAGQWYHQVFFYDGYLLYNKKCYDFIVELAKTEKKDSPKMRTALQVLSIMPIIENNKIYRVNYDTFKLVELKTFGIPLGCKTLTQCKNGEIVSLHGGAPNLISNISDELLTKLFDYVSSV